MHQPTGLKTDAYLPWSRGRGNDVWQVLKACCDGDLKMLTGLLDREPSLVDCEISYYRPLHFAVRENHFDIVKLLIDRGAHILCSGLGYEPAWRPKNPKNHQWIFTMAKERGYHEVSAFLETTARQRYEMRPEGEIIANAIRTRDASNAIALIEKHPDWLEAADGFGTRPLHWASLTRQADLIETLLDRGAQIDAARPDGARAIELARGDYHYRAYRDLPKDAPQSPDGIVELLIQRGADYDLSLAAKRGDMARVQELLELDPTLANRLPSSSGYYNHAPLANAAASGHMEIVKLLLAHGADPNFVEEVAPQGMALYAAIAGKHWDVVNLLLEHGADATAMVESSGGCYWRAKRDCASPEMLKLIASYGGCCNEELAMYDDDIESLAALLYANPNLEIADHLDLNNDAQLRLALKYQPNVLKEVDFRGVATIERARELANLGLDPTRPNWLEITPLHHFAIDGNIPMADFCLQQGANISAIDDEYKQTPLGWAIRGKQNEMVQWLKARGATE